MRGGEQRIAPRRYAARRRATLTPEAPSRHAPFYAPAAPPYAFSHAVTPRARSLRGAAR